MKSNINRTALYNLIIASLLGEGEKAFNISSNPKKELICPFSMDKIFYLFNYINQFKLMNQVMVEQNKGQFKILLDDDTYRLVNEWYNNEGEKIFRKYFGTSFLTYEAIIITINLFGKRKIEAIGISTSINKRSLQTLSYSINKILNQYVYVSNKQINIPDITNLCKKNVPHLTALDSAELVNFMESDEQESFILPNVRSGV